MHRHYFNRLGLLTAATEDTAAGATPGASSATPPAAGAVELPKPAVAAAKPGVIDNAIALFRDKGALTSEIATLKAGNGSLTAENTQLKVSLAAVTAERDTFKADFSRLEAALALATKEKTTLQVEVAHEMAAAGMPQRSLPANAPKPGESGAAAGSIAEQIEALNTQIEASSDPKEKGRLGQQVWDLMIKQSKTGK